MILSNLDYSLLLKQYSDKGRKGYNPIMLFTILVYSRAMGTYSVDKIIENCKKDISYIFLTEGKVPSRSVFYDFIHRKLTEEIEYDLHYQIINYLHKKDQITLSKLYIDGTKIEANANHYSFVWRGSINYHLVNLSEKINRLYQEYNDFITDKMYATSYGLIPLEPFVIEKLDKAKEIVEINRERKKNNQEKRQNNIILEINDTNIDTLESIGKQLEELAKEEGVDFVHGKGKKKSDIQRLSELFMDYKNSLGIMTNTRHSYSKTDTEATFMRMKEDHMRNGQLKPAYNLQFASENHYIIHALVSQDRTDYSSLEQIVELHNQSLDTKLDKVIADSGYASEHNLSLLEEENIRPFIKLQNHEQKKKRSYKEDIGKYYNMKKINVRNAKGKLITAYVCHDNRILEEIKEEVRIVKGEERVYKVFQSASFEGCLYKEDCLYNYNKDTDVEKNKILRVNERYQKLKEQSEQNILSDEGIIDRQIRSIMAEGYFGDMKGNRKYRRFHFRGLEKINKEILLYVIGINLMKYYRFSKGLLKKLELKVA